METKLDAETRTQGEKSLSSDEPKKYKVTFLPYNITAEVDSSQFPFDDHGKPGSLLDIALAHKVPMAFKVRKCW